MSTTCALTAITGKDGVIFCDGNRVARITNWSLDANGGETTWADSDSAGYINRLPQNRDLTGTADFKLDTTCPQWIDIREGECCNLILAISDGLGTAPAALAWQLPVAVIIRFSLTINVNDAEVVEGSVDFGNSGVYYAPGEAGAPALPVFAAVC